MKYDRREMGNVMFSTYIDNTTEQKLKVDVKN